MSTKESVRKLKGLTLEMPDGLRHIKCPKCAGILHVGVSRINGHTHGQCNTEGCLSFNK